MPRDNPKSEPHPHMKARSEKSKHQLSYNDFCDFRAREENRVDFRCLIRVIF